MKERLRVLIWAILMLVMVSAQSWAEVDTAKLWTKVGEAQEKGLPQTAIKHLKQIYEITVKEKRYGEALRAISTQIVLEANIKGNKPEVKVNLMKAEIKRADASMKPLMKTMLAQWYWHYYSRERYRFLNRTRTADMKEDDFTTWDLPRLFSEISGIYQDLLRQEESMKKIPLSQFMEVLDPGSVSQEIRPTLFDFIAHKGLEFYTSGEQAGARPEDAFEIYANTGAFEDARQFIEYRPVSTDIDSPKLAALVIYQKLIRFHISDAHVDAFLDADLHRLDYVFNVSIGDNKTEIYIKRMKEIAENYPKSEYSSLAYYNWAEKLYNSGDYVQALSIATKGKESHPDSYGGTRCARLINTITAKSIGLSCERVAPPGEKSKIRVKYRNIDTVTLKVVKESWKDYLGRDSSMQSPRYEDLEKLIKRESVAEVTVPLKPTDDYKEKDTLVDLPGLPRGFYRVFASYRKDFSKQENCVQQCFLWVSSIEVVMRERNCMIDGFVLDGVTGNPVPGAAVRLYSLKSYNETSFALTDSAVTDELGHYSFKEVNRDQYWRLRIYATDNKGSEFFDPSDLYTYRTYEQPGYRRAVFFTDRSIYRPGQMIHFKGIIIDVDHSQRNYKVVPGEKVTVCFRDVNSQEIARTTFTTNDFGSFSGTFNAPSDRLTGSMSIVADAPGGSCSVRVEEYKRPKFKVEVKVPEKSFRLGEEVPVEGEAIAYTGAPVDGAKVSYRVVREVRMPYWWFYYWYGRSFESQEIAHGAASTDVNGKFTIRFSAKPDESIPKSDEPTFIYRIFADVTDSSGETRSDQQTIRLGYTSMEAVLSTGSWQVENSAVPVSVTTTTLDGKPVAAKGSVEIFSLRQPEQPVRAGLTENQGGGSNAPGSDPRLWPAAGKVTAAEFATSESESTVLKFSLKAGAYRAILTSQDRFGNKVTAQLPIIVCNPQAKSFSLRVPSYYVTKSSLVEVGETFEALWGTGYASGRAFVEIFQGNNPVKRFWTDPSMTQGLITLPVEAKLRGGFTVCVTYVREHRLYAHRSDVVVPWSNKKFDVSLETFRSKLIPGQEETWTLKVKGPGADRRAAELVAALYDESLDAFLPHSWQTLMSYFGHNYTSFNQRFSNADQQFYAWFSSWHRDVNVTERVYVNFIQELVEDYGDYGYATKSRMRAPMEASDEERSDKKVGDKLEEAPAPSGKANAQGGRNGGEEAKKDMAAQAGQPGQPKKMDVQPRKNLKETAFFYPHLLTDKDGSVKITFTMPEALTRWHFMALAHGKEMESGFVEGHTVTQKDLMVQPNPPRFLREGDILEFTVKVTNMIEKEQKGTVRLTFFEPGTDQSLDAVLGNTQIDQDMIIPPKQSRSFSWKINVPDKMKIAGYRAMAAAEDKKDGEEGEVPVLSRRIFVHESIPLWINGPGEKKFTFSKLAKSKESDTLVHEGFTVQVASNPAWYAVQALPFLMEFPHECSEQVFNRLYANALARHIAASDPKIRAIFNTWRDQQPEALLSNLEKNEQLKSVFLIDTPWVLEAKSESQAKRNVGILFDDTRMHKELSSAYSKLKNMQLDNGAWPWFPGGYPDTYITLYVTTGFGRLKHMNVKGPLEYDCALKSLGYLDNWILEVYREILRHHLEKENNLSSTIAMYLYGRSFFLRERPIPQESKVAVDYFLAQGKKYWLKVDSRMSQAHLALSLWRFGDKSTAKDIMASMKERSQVDEELGRFWSELEISWWWFRAPIETQALMIEAFDEIMNDKIAVEECKVWLLKQKQTQDWKTTKATADAVYGLLLRGEKLLSSDALVKLSLGGEVVKPEHVEAGTGFYEKRYPGSEVKPSFGEITMKKEDKGIAWGGAHWQYLEDISKVTPHTQNPLTLKKTLFIQRNTKAGPVIEPLSGALEVGDLLKVRVELRVDRDMEYVHMRDDRGSGLEPTNVLSRYKYQDGLRYYESTKDTATHFYIDYLPKGTYVFEYPLRVVHRGGYQSGLAHIECMYAPEFNSHSQSFKLEVK